MKTTFPTPRIIYVDVDGTLINGVVPNASLVAWLRQRKADGFRLFLWSMRGDEHALAAATLAGCVDVFDAILPKPGHILDDKGWAWIRDTNWVRSL
jgi:ribonucleotide monophosphatase NagD (HAD superfamily)